MSKKRSCQDIVDLVTDYIEDALPGEECSRSREVNGYHNYGDPWKEQRYWGD